MNWFKKIPWLSLTLLLLTYGTTGWIYANWGLELIEQGRFLSSLARNLSILILYGMGGILISSFVIVFTAPISLVTVSFDSWLKSEVRAFVSIFIGAFAFAIIVQKIAYFARFLVLLSAILLFKLDLQLAGCSRWLALSILIIFCWLGFAGGILAFGIWGFEQL